MGKFKKGDKVRFFTRRPKNAARFLEGELTVDSVLSDGGVVLVGYPSTGPSYYQVVQADDITLVEPEPKWVPKVGDRVRFTKDNPNGGPSFGRSGQEVTVTDAELHSGSSYGVQIVVSDPGCGHAVNAPVDCLEPIPPAKTTTLTIEPGKFYKTRDGRKVGPMLPARSFGYSMEYPFTVDHFVSGINSGKAWRGDGSFSPSKGEKQAVDIIAEWVDEPAATAEAAKPKFKVGDRVRLKESSQWTCSITSGLGTVVPSENGDLSDVGVKFDGDDGFVWHIKPYDLYTNAPTTPAIVALIENDTPKPSATPKVHASQEAAAAEATRLAELHKGKKFGVFVLADTKEVAKPVYEHEWQRLAAEGNQRGAARSLQDNVGMSFISARRVVADFLAAA